MKQLLAQKLKFLREIPIHSNQEPTICAIKHYLDPWQKHQFDSNPKIQPLRHHLVFQIQYLEH